jgi:carbohydrate kinase (thermoresistant glucokinase family)
MTETPSILFLFDVDNTLLDNDRVQAHLKEHLAETYGATARDRYWDILEQLRGELGYVDYLGALERFRIEEMHRPDVLRMSSWLVEYPFADRLYPGALSAVRHVQQWGPAVILSDGDAVFQPRKVERSGLWDAFNNRVLIYIHKEEELDDVERLYPANRYVLIDDKLRILSAVKKIWGERVTTVFPRQGHYALDPNVVAEYPPADIELANIGDLVNCDLSAFGNGLASRAVTTGQRRTRQRSDQEPGDPPAASNVDAPSQVELQEHQANAADDQAILIVTGVSGSGKTTIATMLAERLNWPFKEGDDPDVAKAHSAHPLDDRDRWRSLEKVTGWIDDWRRGGQCGVITCAALKRSYRDFLTSGRPEVRIVYLHGDRAMISARLAARKESLTSSAVLDHQFAILEEPEPDEDPIRVNVGRLVEDIVTEIMHGLGRPISDSRSPVVDRDPGERPSGPQVKPELQQATANIGPRPGGGRQASIGADLPLKIEDYALIGDCITAALVGRNGSIDWLCWPRFDSNACFAALLGTSEHGRWRVCPADPAARVSRAYRDGTMVLETVFETADGRVAVIDFMPVGQSNSSVIRLVKGQRGKVAMRSHLAIRFDYGVTVPWVTQLEDASGLSAVAGPSLVVLRSPVPLQGRNFATVAEFDVAEGECVPFVLTHGPSDLPPPAPVDWGAALQETESFWRAWSSRCCYGGRNREAVHRSLLTLKALTYAQTGGIVAAPTTSLPEQLGGERNWDYRYCWLRDATLTLMALSSAGYREEAQAWRAWLQRSVAGSPNQLQIMYGLSGERQLTEWEVPWLPGYQGAAPVRIGNAAAVQLQLDVYGELMDAIYQARKDALAPIASAWEQQLTLIEHLERIWEQPDDGIWEVRGGRQHFTFSKIMAWVALDRSVRDAERFKLQAPIERWRRLRDHMHATICQHGYDSSRNTFTQSFGSSELDASLLLTPVVGFLPPDDPRVRGTVAAIERELMVDGFVLRYRTKTGVDGLPPGEGVFLPCSFWLADNYTLQNRDAEASALFERLLSLRNDVGLLAEEYDPHARRQVGNFPQAFSHLALVGTALNLHEVGPSRSRCQ